MYLFLRKVKFCCIVRTLVCRCFMPTFQEWNIDQNGSLGKDPSAGEKITPVALYLPLCCTSGLQLYSSKLPSSIRLEYALSELSVVTMLSGQELSLIESKKITFLCTSAYKRQRTSRTFLLSFQNKSLCK